MVREIPEIQEIPRNPKKSQEIPRNPEKSKKSREIPRNPKNPKKSEKSQEILWDFWKSQKSEISYSFFDSVLPLAMNNYDPFDHQISRYFLHKTNYCAPPPPPTHTHTHARNLKKIMTCVNVIRPPTIKHGREVNVMVSPDYRDYRTNADKGAVLRFSRERRDF